MAQSDPNIAKTIEKVDQFLAIPQVCSYLEARRRAIATQATLMRTNLRKGIEKGMKKGLAKGRAETAVKDAKRLLLHRFGQLPPAVIQPLDQKLKSTPDEVECDRIVDLALDCASLDEFLASL